MDQPYPRPDIEAALELPPARRRLLDIAALAFMERGYDATSIDEIATRFGATKGAVYYSYRSKLEVFLGVYERGMLVLEERVSSALATATGTDAAELLRAVSIAQVHNIMENYAYHVVIQHGVEQRRQMALRDADRQRLSELDAMRQRHEELITSLIDQGHLDGSLRAVSSRLASRTLLGGVAGVAIWFRPRDNQTSVELANLAQDVVDVLLRGVTIS